MGKKSICKITYREFCLVIGPISPATPEQSTPVLYHENKVSGRKQVAKKSDLRNRKNREPGKPHEHLGYLAFRATGGHLSGGGEDRCYTSLSFNFETPSRLLSL